MGKLYTLAVGQGDFAVLVGDTEAIVIDTNLPPVGEKETIFVKGALSKIAKGKNVVGVIITGLDDDHAVPKGLGMVLKNYNPSWIMYPKYKKETKTAREVFKLISEIEKEKEGVFGRISVTMENIGRPPVGKAAVKQTTTPSASVEDLLVPKTGRPPVGSFFFKSIDELLIPPTSTEKLGRPPFAKKKIASPTSISSLNEFSKDFSFVAFSPYPKYETSSNNASLVLKITERATKRSILVTGDTEGGRWDEICRYQGQRLQSDILQAPHHGSKNGITQKAFDLISPHTVLISAGEGNQWDFPNDEALKIMSGAKRYSTHHGYSLATYFDSDRIETYKADL